MPVFGGPELRSLLLEDSYEEFPPPYLDTERISFKLKTCPLLLESVKHTGEDPNDLRWTVKLGGPHEVSWFWVMELVIGSLLWICGHVPRT